MFYWSMKIMYAWVACVNNMAHHLRSRVPVIHNRIKSSLVWFLKNQHFLPQTFNALRSFHRNLPSQFRVSLLLPRSDESHFKKYTEKDWRTRLSPQQYHICREKGTEAPWSGELLDNKNSGIYCCVGCDAHLFSSTTKYDSQSGWPSFWAAIEHEQTEEQNALGIPNLSVDQVPDNSHGMVRVEVQCKQCGSHLGHVFRDGPKPNGLRYCINSIALKFKPNMTE